MERVEFVSRPLSVESRDGMWMWMWMWMLDAMDTYYGTMVVVD